jgi:glycine amidinotransferase
MLNNKKIVNSWNEWDLLKRVILGSATYGMIQAPEPAVYKHFPE